MGEVPYTTIRADEEEILQDDDAEIASRREMGRSEALD
jgi:hypothetical protein